MDLLFGEDHVFADLTFDSVAKVVRPLLLHAIEAELGQEARKVLESLLESEGFEINFTFERVFELLSEAHIALDGHSWFELFLKPAGEKAKDASAPASFEADEAEGERRMHFLIKVFEGLFHT